MFTILEYLKNRYLSQKAQGIVEYALILAFVAIVGAVLASGGDITTGVKNAFTKISNILPKTSS